MIRILESEGVNLAEADWTPDAVAAHFNEISDMSKAKALQGAFDEGLIQTGRGHWWGAA